MRRKTAHFSLVFILLVLISTLESCDSNPKEGTSNQEAISLDTYQALSASRLDSISSQRIFVKDIEKDPYIIGDGGLLIYVQKNALLNAQGKPVTKDIEFELKEVQSLDDFVVAGISTTSDGKLLSTAGSYYVMASSNKAPLSINPEIGLNIAFPTIRKDPEIELFRGEVLDSGGINWIPTQTAETSIPRPNIKKPKNLANFEGQLELRKAEAFLKDIDNNHQKVGDEYVHLQSPDNKMKWNATYVENVRSWYEYNKYKQEAYRKQVKIFREALDKYLSNPKVQEWLAYLDIKKEQLNKQVSSYEYSIKQFGWLNCDKFNQKELASFTGNIVDGNGQDIEVARVHLISWEKMVHVERVIEESNFQFEFPKGAPFEIFIKTSDGELKEEFNGDKQDLGKLILR